MTWTASQVVCLDFCCSSKQIGEFKGEGTKKELIVFNIVQIVSNLVIWGLIAPVGDVLDLQGKVPQSSYKVSCCVSLPLTVAVAGSLLTAYIDSNKRWKFDQRLNVQKIRERDRNR